MSPCYDSRTNGQCHLRMLVELGGGSTLESGFDGLCMLFIIIHPIQLHCGSYLQKCASSVPTLEDSKFSAFKSNAELLQMTFHPKKHAYQSLLQIFLANLLFFRFRPKREKHILKKPRSRGFKLDATNLFCHFRDK